ncbi:MAG TPA: ribosome assembly RNA-binding protein YhbY [Mariprofundaceae bacterium]|nr:ribosome assembly RNA-binding protein YhbY [Mariprofundaceae bacterium]
MTLSTKQRKELKARAHHLNPVIRVGQKGISDNLLKETDLALQSHELIKVHIAQEDRAERQATAAEIAAACHAEIVAHIGKVSILFRERREQ